MPRGRFYQFLAGCGWGSPHRWAEAGPEHYGGRAEFTVLARVLARFGTGFGTGKTCIPTNVYRSWHGGTGHRWGWVGVGREVVSYQ